MSHWRSTHIQTHAQTRANIQVPQLSTLCCLFHYVCMGGAGGGGDDKSEDNERIESSLTENRDGSDGWGNLRAAKQSRAIVVSSRCQDRRAEPYISTPMRRTRTMGVPFQESFCSHWRFHVILIYRNCVINTCNKRLLCRFDDSLNTLMALAW